MRFQLAREVYACPQTQAGSYARGGSSSIAVLLFGIWLQCGQFIPQELAFVFWFWNAFEAAAISQTTWSRRLGLVCARQGFLCTDERHPIPFGSLCASCGKKSNSSCAERVLPLTTRVTSSRRGGASATEVPGR